MSQIIFSTNSYYIGDKPRRNVLVHTDQGMMIVNRFDCNENYVGHSQWLLDHGNCNTPEVNDCYQSIKHLVEPVIIDVGANIGTISLWLAQMKPLGKIYSFEAQRQVFYQLCGNIALNNLYNVEAFNYAIGYGNYYITVPEPNYFSNHDFGTFSLIEEKIPTTEKSLTVPLINLDQFVTDFKLKQVDLIKIDAEGMDLDVLKGSKNILEQFSPTIYIEHFDNRVSKLDEIQNFLSAYDYQFDIRKNNLLCQR